MKAFHDYVFSYASYPYSWAKTLVSEDVNLVSFVLSDFSISDVAFNIDMKLPEGTRN